jgi:hypothetical protein
MGAVAAVFLVDVVSGGGLRSLVAVVRDGVVGVFRTRVYGHR